MSLLCKCDRYQSQFCEECWIPLENEINSLRNIRLDNVTLSVNPISTEGFSFLDNETIFDDYKSVIRSRQLMSDEQRNIEGQGKKYDGDKSRPELISPFGLDVLSRILAKGARKYSSRNWELGFDWTRSIGALLRHTFLYMKGYTHDIDQDCADCKEGTLDSMNWKCKKHTGESHMGCVMCNAMFLVHFEHNKPEMNDIPDYRGK